MPTSDPVRPEIAYPSTILETVNHETEVRKSRFIATLAPVDTIDAAQDVIAHIRKEHWNARHNCTAFILGPIGENRRSSDDGEPSGTAGVPMLELLSQRKLTDIVAVVTRYFGGVLLGTGGLVRAYSGAVSAALDDAHLVSRRELRNVSIQFSHALSGRAENIVREWCINHDAQLENVKYEADVTFSIGVPPKMIRALESDIGESFSGQAVFDYGEIAVFDVI